MMQKEVTRSRSSASNLRSIHRAETASGPTHGEIAKRAYEIWCGKGRPHGSDRENWLEAERQLLAERAARA